VTVKKTIVDIWHRLSLMIDLSARIASSKQPSASSG